ncbi:hypothetical protein TNCV_2385921 [Trichonephila clavipes]|nr:hypothetical protein TNCV_2385921 [Trichonephila clavipes]
MILAVLLYEENHGPTTSPPMSKKSSVTTVEIKLSWLFKKAYLSPLERDLREKVSLNDSRLLVRYSLVTNQTIIDPCLFFTTESSTS